jgi:hypothetical protein
MKEVKTGTYIHITENGEETHNFNFYADLSVAKKMNFVDSVVSLLVDENHYNSVIRNLVFDFYVIDIFTDIDTTDLVSSNNFLDDVEKFLDETNVVEIVKANSPIALFAELNDAVDKSIQYLTGIHSNPLNDALASLLNTIESKVNEIDLDSMMTMAQKFASMTEDFTMENAVNAYMNSDIHKRNLAEIAEVKNAK